MQQVPRLCSAPRPSGAKPLMAREGQGGRGGRQGQGGRGGREGRKGTRLGGHCRFLTTRSGSGTLPGREHTVPRRPKSSREGAEVIVHVAVRMVVRGHAVVADCP